VFEESEGIRRLDWLMIDLVLATVLVALAALHAYWGMGGRWPGTDDASLARTVAGFSGVSAMPPAGASFVVALCLLAAALWAAMLTGRVGIGLPVGLLTLGGFALTAVFLGRGVAAYVPAWRRLTPEQPFARLDQQVYGPLCLVIGALLAVVTLRAL
jgi:Protein of unknown function (DUF3995)